MGSYFENYGENCFVTDAQLQYVYSLYVNFQGSGMKTAGENYLISKKSIRPHSLFQTSAPEIIIKVL